MTIINLRDFYYWYTQDEYIEVSDDVAEALRASVRYEAAYTERARYNNAYYSLDSDDDIEYVLPSILDISSLHTEPRIPALQQSENTISSSKSFLALSSHPSVFYSVIIHTLLFQLFYMDNRSNTSSI